MNFHLSYAFWLKTTLLEIQGLLNSVKRMQLHVDTLSRELNFIKPEQFAAYQVGMLFPGNIITIFLSSFGDSVVSLRIVVWEAGIWILLPPGLPLWDSCAKIKLQVVQGRNFLCGPRMLHLLGEAVRAQGLPGGGCAQYLPGEWGGFRSLQEGPVQGKKAEFWSKVTFSLFSPNLFLIQSVYRLQIGA